MALKSLFPPKGNGCVICGARQGLHKHHIFFGTDNRRKSEEYGCYCYLCYTHHATLHWDAKSGHELDYTLKKECQRRFEKKYGHDKFMSVFHKNYL